MAEWDEILKREEFRTEEPNKAVVKLVSFLKARNVKKMLDLGCGAGRHLVFLARKGFEVYGTDISEIGLDQARRQLRKEELEAELKRSDMTVIPYADSFFDALISIWVIYHNPLEAMRKTVSEIHRVLNEGGLVFLTFQSKRSYKFGKGKEIEKDTFVLEEGPEKGVLHHFSEKNEIEELLKEFHILDLRLDEFTGKGGELNSHWEVLAEKT